jgi:D-alanyl-D-alanine carboxypeptidase
MINHKLLALFILAVFTACQQSKYDKLDELLKKTYPAGQPGAAVGIVEKGELVFEKYYGMADLADSTRITDSTRFNIASITKQFTAYAILHLVKGGIISLDDTLKSFFPQLHPSIANAITIRHLLTHTSGLKEHYTFVQLDSGSHATDYDVLRGVEKMDSLYFQPGTQYRYSNTAYCLLALVIKQITGVEYREILKNHIFQNIKMTRSDVIDMTEPLRNRALGYSHDSAKNRYTQSDARENTFFTTQGDGGIYTSLRDYIKWFNELQKNEEVIEQARQIQFMIDSSKKLGYGYGWFVGALEKPEIVYHTGSNGGFRAIVVTIPSENYALIIFSNRTGIDLEKLAVEINRIFNKDNKSLQRIDSLISFNHSWPIFAPCKKTRRFLISSTKNWNGREMA